MDWNELREAEEKKKKEKKIMRDTLISSHLLTIMMIAVVSLHQQFSTLNIFIRSDVEKEKNGERE